MLGFSGDSYAKFAALRFGLRVYDVLMFFFFDIQKINCSNSFLALLNILRFLFSLSSISG